MKFNIWQIIANGGNVSVPVPHISITQMMKEEHMNFLDFIHLPWWLPYAGAGIAALFVVLLLGSLKSLIGWPGLAVLTIILALAAGEVDGARRALDFTASHYAVKTHITDLPRVFL